MVSFDRRLTRCPKCLAHLAIVALADDGMSVEDTSTQVVDYLDAIANGEAVWCGAHTAASSVSKPPINALTSAMARERGTTVALVELVRVVALPSHRSWIGETAFACGDAATPDERIEVRRIMMYSLRELADRLDAESASQQKH